VFIDLWFREERAGGDVKENGLDLICLTYWHLTRALLAKEPFRKRKN
jgi:hypothetical protein